MSRQVGLRDIYVAELLTDTSGVAGETTYETPIKLERAISAKLSPKSSSESVYSDDAVEDIISAFEGVEVEIEVSQLSLTSRALLQGAKVVKGVLIENKEDMPPTIALGFKSKKNNKKYRYVWLLKGKFAPSNDDYETEAEKPKSQSATLKGTFYSRDSDGNYRFIADEDEVGADQTIITSWFTAVLEEPVVV